MNIKDLPSYVDDRGVIQMIMESCKIGSISLIKSEAGKTRANHTHFLDHHYIFITIGSLEIYERHYKSNKKPIKIVLNVGDIHLTKKLLSHTMFFPEHCEFFCFSKLPRNTENYEKETVRFDYSLRDVYNNWKN